MKKTLVGLLILGLLMSFAGCGGQEGAVFVQSVASLSAMGGIAPGDRFGGLVVSESVTEIQKDPDKNIEELRVREGDDVAEGQILFSYDTEQLQLTLDKQLLEKEQLGASIEYYTNQIAQLEKDRERANARDKLQYTIQIQTNQIDLKEAELNLKTKEAEITKSQTLLENADVVSPVNGRVTSISENGADNYGNPLAYITIQKTGSYRVKGMLNELQRGSLMEGDRIRMQSRTDASLVWFGTITLVDYENPSQGTSNNYYYSDSDDMSNSSRYPFYVELDDITGLLLGQHLYLSLDTGEDAEEPALTIGSAFVAFDDDGSPFVWADNGKGKLEKRSIQLGEYDFMRDVYPVLEGLTEADYIAYPDPEVCTEGAAVTRTRSAMESGVD